MNEQDKELLLKDLCARLRYGVKVQIKANLCYDSINTLNLDDLKSFIENSPRDEDWYDIVTSIKPYLRPMSSMTDEEIKEYTSLIQNVHWTRVGLEERGILSVDLAECKADNEGSIENVYNVISLSPIDYLNAHHFDFRGLIPMGLGIDCTGLNIY